MKSCFFRSLLIALVILTLTVLPHPYLIGNEAALAASENIHVAQSKQTAVQADDSMTAVQEETVVAPSEKDLGDPVNSADEIIDDDFYEDEPVNHNGNGPQIADPIEPFNRAMYHFNDKLYFWVLKPVATGYNKAVPEIARVRVKNFFTNLAFPIRFVSCILQADPAGAAQETGRFFINTIWGLAGFFDPASEPGANLAKQDADLGQSFGLWGIGQGFYIVWPVFGPSSPRDTVGMVGEFFLYPVSYLSPWYTSTGVKTYEKVNDTSLRLGDYEALKDAAIDPYIAIRDAYVQYRYKKIEKKLQKLWPAQTEKAEPVD